MSAFGRRQREEGILKSIHLEIMNRPQPSQQTLYLRIRDLARLMRKHCTRAEMYFWMRMRNRQFMGLKFNRQFIIQCPLDGVYTKYYIADFCCHELKLVVELDGNVHLKQQEED